MGKAYVVSEGVQRSDLVVPWRLAMQASAASRNDTPAAAHGRTVIVGSLVGIRAAAILRRAHWAASRSSSARRISSAALASALSACWASQSKVAAPPSHSTSTLARAMRALNSARIVSLRSRACRISPSTSGAGQDLLFESRLQGLRHV